MTIRRPRALGNRGIAHFLLPILCIVLVAAIGAYMIVGSKAATPQTKLSTYYLYSFGGAYTHVQVSSSKAFKNARCGNNKIAKGKSVTLATPAKKKDSYPALAIRCVTPTKASDVYYVNFYRAQPTGAPDINTAITVSHTTNLCIFIHAPDAPNAQEAGEPLRTLPRGADGKCVKSGDEEATKEKAPAVDASTSLYVPPNFSLTKKNKAGYYFLPPSPGNKDYYIHTKTMPGHESTSASPASQRYGRKNTVLMFYDVAVKYNQKYSNSKLVAGDLNAPEEHLSHDQGIDIDVYTSDRSAARASGNDDRSVALAKLFLKTRKVEVIFFNDTAVVNRVNAWVAKWNEENQKKKHPEPKITGRMQTLPHLPSHEYHFHVRTNENPGPLVQ